MVHPRDPHRSAKALALPLVLISGLAVPSSAQDQKLTAATLFAPDHVVQVKVELEPADWRALCGQSRTLADSLLKTAPKRPYTYFKATVTIDGVRIENVGIRKKGFLGSLDDERPSLKIKFDEYVDQAPATGIDRITLNNNKQDASQLCQVLMYGLFRKAGLPAPRCNFARVTVNGTSLGIYSHVESIKKPFLRHAFGADTGMLYEGTLADFYASTVGKFQLKTKNATTTPLEAITKALHADPIDLEALEKSLDLDRFLRFWAMESLVSFWDGYSNNQNNFYLYRNPKDDRIVFIPWGADSAFTGRMPLAPYFIKNKSVHHQSILCNRLYRVPAVRDRYKQTLERLLADAWKEDDLLAETRRIEALVADHLHARQSKFPGSIKKIRSWIKGRRKVLDRELRKWPLRIRTGPRSLLYFKPIGTAKGSFETTWQAGSIANPKFTGGTATLELEIDGEPVAVKRVGITAALSNWPTLDGGPKPPAIFLSAPRQSDGKQLILVMTPARADFRPGDGKSVVAQGAFLEGQFAFLNPKAMMMVGGDVTLAEASMKVGAKVRGTFDVRIVKMVGGDTPIYEEKDGGPR